MSERTHCGWCMEHLRDCRCLEFCGRPAVPVVFGDWLPDEPHITAASSLTSDGG